MTLLIILITVPYTNSLYLELSFDKQIVLASPNSLLRIMGLEQTSVYWKPIMVYIEATLITIAAPILTKSSSKVLPLNRLKRHPNLPQRNPHLLCHLRNTILKSSSMEGFV